MGLALCNRIWPHGEQGGIIGFRHLPPPVSEKVVSGKAVLSAVAVCRGPSPESELLFAVFTPMRIVVCSILVAVSALVVAAANNVQMAYMVGTRRAEETSTAYSLSSTPEFMCSS